MMTVIADQNRPKLLRYDDEFSSASPCDVARLQAGHRLWKLERIWPSFYHLVQRKAITHRRWMLCPFWTGRNSPESQEPASFLRICEAREPSRTPNLQNNKYLLTYRQVDDSAYSAFELYLEKMTSERDWPRFVCGEAVSGQKTRAVSQEWSENSAIFEYPDGQWGCS